MSDLQIGLLGVGAFVIIGVYLFNVWQERQFRRRTEQAFAREHDDVLMPPAPASDLHPHPDPHHDSGPTIRIEPTLEAPESGVPAFRPTEPKASESVVIDPVIDYIVEVELDTPAASAELHAGLAELAADWGKVVLVAGYDAAAGEWQPAGSDSGSERAQLRFALQMSNRSGCIGLEQLGVFRDAVQKWATGSGARVKCLDIDLAHAMAVQLDRFCADVDIAIGINVISRDGSPFPGTKIRALAEAGGLKLESDGVFYLRGDDGNTLYTLDNHEPMPFMPEQIKTMSTGGLTFLLDVPRVADALGEFESMLGCARNFASTLGGALVDDNRSPLTDEAIEKIRRQLTGILAKMEAGQIAAGGARALRLFA